MKFFRMLINLIAFGLKATLLTVFIIVVGTFIMRSMT